MSQSLNAQSNIEGTLRTLTTHVLSTPARVGHVLLLLAALAMSILFFALLVTEPALPTRTRAAFLLMLLIGLSWAAYALWVLKNRLTVLANHAIVAGRMAVAFSAIFTAAALAAGVLSGRPAAYVAAGVGVVQLALAVQLLIRAQRRYRALQQRRQQLEREIG